MSNVGVQGQVYPETGGKDDLFIRRLGSKYRGHYYYSGAWRTKDNSGPMTIVDQVRALLGNDIVIGHGRGDFTYEDELDILDSRCVVHGEGMDVTELILGNGINKDLIDFAGGRFVNTKIHSLKLNGNGANNPTGGDCINGLIASGAVPESMGWWYDIWDVRTYNARDKGIDVGMTTTPASPQGRLHNVRSYDNLGTPEINIKNGYDSQYTQIWSSSMRFDGCAGSTITTLYVGGGGSMIYIKGDKIHAVLGIVDNVPNAVSGLRIVGDFNHVYTGVTNKQNSTAESAIQVTGVGNLIEVLVADDADTAGFTWDILCEELGASARNRFKVHDPCGLATTYDLQKIIGGRSEIEITPRRLTRLNWV